MNMMFCPRVASCFSCPLRKPSPKPTSSRSEPTPQAIPNMVRKERSLCAHSVESDCRTMSRSMRMWISRRIMPPRLRGGARGHPGNVQARGLNPAQPSDQKYAAGFVKVPYCMWLFRPEGWQKVSSRGGLRARETADKAGLLLLLFLGALVPFLQILSGFLECAEGIVIRLQRLTVLAYR